MTESNNNINKCRCCGATAEPGANIEHDELCSYNNTKNAIKSFIPQEFTTGKDHMWLYEQGLHMLKDSDVDEIDILADELTDGNPAKRMMSWYILRDSEYIKFTKREWSILMKQAEYNDINRDVLFNLLLFKRVNRIIYKSIKDDYFRNKARAEAVFDMLLKEINKQ